MRTGTRQKRGDNIKRKAARQRGGATLLEQAQDKEGGNIKRTGTRQRRGHITRTGTR